jgi:hypothetical protein
MSQTLYLVRLRSVFRVREIYDVRVDRLPAEALFATREAAESYIATHLPLAHNPFARMEHTLSVESQGQFIVTSEYEGETPVTQFYEWLPLLGHIQEAGVELPDECGWNPDVWPLWWDIVTSEMSCEEKDNFRVRLGLPNWAENPFAVADFDIGLQTLGLFYKIALADLRALIQNWDTPLPNLPPPFTLSVNDLVWWWEHNAPHMTDEQKAALWRLLDPQPWEIVEVELEGKL